MLFSTSNIVHDKTGFPMIRIGTMSGHMHIWPITKIQFECFICETGLYDEKWYELLLKLNPRVSVNTINKRNYQGTFMSGILVQEAIAFAEYMGDSFDLPSVDEWRTFHHHLSRLNECPIDIHQQNNNESPSQILGKKIMEIFAEPLSFSLLRHGLLEWVKDSDDYCALGQPKPEFFGHTLNPKNDKIVINNSNERLHAIGFRLIKRETGDQQ